MDKQKYIEMILATQGNSAGKFLEIVPTDVGEDFIELQMPITDKVRQPYGILHGGMSMVLAETAASIHASYGLDLSKEVPVGVEISGSHVGMAKDGHVKAIAKVAKRSRKFVVHTVEIRHVETDELLSTARVTNYFKSIDK